MSEAEMKKIEQKRQENESRTSQKMQEDSSVKDEYAEVPEEVLNNEEMKELKQMKEETEKRINGNGKMKMEVTDETLGWEPKTQLGRDVKDGKITDIDEILENDFKILEPEIIDKLIEVESDLISIGQSKGKFGGGKRRAWRQTQRKTKEGNVPSFSAMAVVGDKDGHIGIGNGKAKETLPARDKAIREAKLKLFKIKRGCSAFDCNCSEKHTIPFQVEGKAGSIRVKLIPAPQGTGLVVGKEIKKVLQLAGIEDIYSKTFGHKKTTFNMIKACVDALKKTNPEVGK